ncbi:SRPBCC family protein [Natrinema salifodinae]|uniref:Polyketide cyclase / dehydrase and lipid transport n=1 Tax=Natrinema salifodinae TaxID=1202768 RepID=A0A1I0N473_9EURY|nr:SRPBCC family protein [Natrinema salifodinae]SEV95881.1 Polyketide cyclase / dehydrase and lipid transport [Natrinema salifodinae]
MTRVRTTHTPDGRRIEVSHVFTAPAADAWEALVDTTRWPAWSPIVIGVESTDRRIQPDTTGRIRVPGAWVPFRITSRTERRWTWRVSGIPAAGHRVDDLGEGRCRVAFELPLHGTGYVPICLRALENLETVLEGDQARTEPSAA